MNNEFGPNRNFEYNAEMSYLFRVLIASSLVFGLPYIFPSNVTIVSAPMMMSIFDFPSVSSVAFSRSDTSSTFCRAVSSTNSEKSLKSFGSRFSLKFDAHASTFKPCS